eukprot:symbB.v1.2.030926.t1/scaffold3519.1/size65392/5
MEVGTDESVVAISFDENSTGKTFADTKVRYIWEVMVDGKIHRIEFTNTKTSGKKRIFVDGRLLHEMTAKQMGSWYVFNLGQSCACAPCPGENATVATAPTAALRGNLGQAPAEMPTGSTESQKLKSLELAEADPSEEAAWEAAAVRGSNLLYCRCGKGCAYGRQLGLYTYYCFRYGCKPCPK